MDETELERGWLGEAWFIISSTTLILSPALVLLVVTLIIFLIRVA